MLIGRIGTYHQEVITSTKLAVTSAGGQHDHIAGLDGHLAPLWSSHH